MQPQTQSAVGTWTCMSMPRTRRTLSDPPPQPEVDRADDPRGARQHRRHGAQRSGEYVQLELLRATPADAEAVAQQRRQHPGGDEDERARERDARDRPT